MFDLHDIISGGTVAGPLIIIAFVLVYLAFFRNTHRPHH
jgi:hypothetical protein